MNELVLRSIISQSAIKKVLGCNSAFDRHLLKADFVFCVERSAIMGTEECKAQLLLSVILGSKDTAVASADISPLENTELGLCGGSHYFLSQRKDSFLAFTKNQ